MSALKNLTTNELLISTDRAVNVEKDAVRNTTSHFEEVFRRKAYLPTYATMFDFLTKKYGYCNNSAQIRINTIRLIADVPDVKQKLESGELTMVGGCKYSKFPRRRKKVRARTKSGGED